MVEIGVGPESRMRASDRVFALEIVDGKKPQNSTGLVDPRLFKNGEDKNRLHAVSDKETGLWSFKYEKGGIPEGLKGQWTAFRFCRKYAEDYFSKRNIRIVEVQD